MTNDESKTKPELRKNFGAIRVSHCVIPSSSVIRISRLLLQALNDADERHEQGDHDGADDECEKNDHDWLKRCGHGRDRVIDFIIINLSDFQKHLRPLTGFLAQLVD